MPANLVDSESGTYRAVIVGTGRVGSALIRLLPEHGINVQAVVSRHPESVKNRLSPDIRLVRDICDAGASDILILAVPDDKIEGISAEIADRVPPSQYSFALHTSGFLPSSVLSRLHEKDVETASFHPITAFPPPGSDHNPFLASVVSIEGTGRAADMARELVLRLGAKPITVDADQKRALHTAASIAANFSTALTGWANEIIVDSGLDCETSRAVLQPLLSASAENLRHLTPSEALTGPIVRGDVEVVKEHLSLLAQRLPDFLMIYREMAMLTVRLAQQSGRLTETAAERLHAVILPADNVEERSRQT